MNDNLVYCMENCDYTQCKRNKKYAGPNAKLISNDLFIGCHVKLYVKGSKPTNCPGVLGACVELNNQK